jgi:hypothetical protein
MINKEDLPHGLEPVSHIAGAKAPGATAIASGVRINLRGRCVRLRGLKTADRNLAMAGHTGAWVDCSSAGNDAGGIATYSAFGARYGYDLIWVMRS